MPEVPSVALDFLDVATTTPLEVWQAEHLLCIIHMIDKWSVHEKELFVSTRTMNQVTAYSHMAAAVNVENLAPWEITSLMPQEAEVLFW